MTRRRIIRDAHRPPRWHPEYTPPRRRPRRLSVRGVALLVTVCAGLGLWLGVLAAGVAAVRP